VKSRCVVQDHYDDERNKTVFHNTRPARPRPTKADFLVSDRSYPKTYGLRPHRWYTWRSRKQFNASATTNQNRNFHAV